MKIRSWWKLGTYRTVNRPQALETACLDAFFQENVPALITMPQSTNVEHALRRSTLAIVMGGGAGTRLYPLTKDRAKPAVPLAGKYRLVDIPISNCINSGVRQVFVLTQYNSMSLNRHIARTYKFDQFTRGFVEVLAAQQTPEGERWYQGTADAVRQNLRYLIENDYDY